MATRSPLRVRSATASGWRWPVLVYDVTDYMPPGGYAPYSNGVLIPWVQRIEFDGNGPWGPALVTAYALDSKGSILTVLTPDGHLQMVSYTTRVNLDPPREEADTPIVVNE